MPRSFEPIVNTSEHPDTDDEPDDVGDLKATAVASSGPAEGTRLRVWWPTEQRWFEGVVRATRPQDGRIISRVDYDDGETRWYDLADAQHKKLHACCHAWLGAPCREDTYTSDTCVHAHAHAHAHAELLS